MVFIYCLGYQPKVPRPFHKNYPLQYHSNMPNLPFYVHGEVVRATACYKRVLQKDECKQLADNAYMQTIEWNASSQTPPFGVQHSLWTPRHSSERIFELKRKNDVLRLDIYNKNHEIQSKNGQISLYKRFMILIANNDIPRLKSLLRTMLDNCRSVDSIISKMTDAIDGVYRAQQYDQRDLDAGYIAWKIGGPQLLPILQQSHGFPSLSTVARRFDAPDFLPSDSVEVDTRLLAHIWPRPLVSRWLNRSC